MNYRHIFHAGNFGDVFKHIILITLIKSLLRKDSAFCYLETHAGEGLYDLLSEAAQKNPEFKNGIEKIFSENQSPSFIKDYLSLIHQVNLTNPEQLQFYPGSPYLAKQLLRSQDHMILCELQQEIYFTLKKFFKNDNQVAIHHQDGIQSLKAFLPPKERRGLILIDPPYETSEELFHLIQPLVSAIQHFETGIYAIWYPIKHRSLVTSFHREIQSTISRTTLITEFCIFPEDIPISLNGCGMLIINPPWQLEQSLQNLLPWLLSKLNITQGHYEIKFLIK